MIVLGLSGALGHDPSAALLVDGEAAAAAGEERFVRDKHAKGRMPLEAGRQLGVDWAKTEFAPVEHRLAHAASAYHCSGFAEKTAILGVDGKGEYATTFFGYGEHGRIHSLGQFHDPDSLSGVYGAMTEHLGFEMLDGECKVMGMAAYGDPKRHDFSRLIKPCGSGFRVNTRYVNTVGLRRHKEDGLGRHFSPKLIDWLGPRRRREDADEPYVHYAAAMQRLFEDWCPQLLEAHLGRVLGETGKLALDAVDELFVQPAAGDSGASLGAAAWVAAARGERLGKTTHAFLGPGYGNRDRLAALDAEAGRVAHRLLDNPPGEAAEIIAAGHPLAWFQGRMEFGPRALGARSILGCPSAPGMADRINEQIKLRERWRPFCPSLLDRVAGGIIGSQHPAPFMTIAFDVAPSWRTRIPEVVHKDGTARVQVVERQANPRCYALLEALERLTGNAVVLNTSLNRRGEPMVCSPKDALDMLLGSGLQYLVMED